MRKSRENISHTTDHQQIDEVTKEVKVKPRYKHKLNMLEPGIKICRGIILLILVSLIAWWLHLTWLVIVTCIGIGIMVVIFVMLLIIEHHQDKMMYLDAKREDPEVK